MYGSKDCQGHRGKDLEIPPGPQRHSHREFMKIYLACPYSDPDQSVREARFREANRAAAIFMNDGHIIFSPISHSHPIASQNELPKGYDFWKTMDESFIEWCDEVWVLKMPGWDKSEGVARECIFADMLGKKVRLKKWTIRNS